MGDSDRNDDDRGETDDGTAVMVTEVRQMMGQR